MCGSQPNRQLRKAIGFGPALQAFRHLVVEPLELLRDSRSPSLSRAIRQPSPPLTRPSQPGENVCCRAFETFQQGPISRLPTSLDGHLGCLCQRSVKRAPS